MSAGLTLYESAIEPHTELHWLPWIKGCLDVLPNVTRLPERTVRFGFDYARPHGWLRPLPSWWKKVEDVMGYLIQPDHPINSLSLNEYLPGQVLPAHYDSEDFGPRILIISLGGDCRMQFLPPRIFEPVTEVYLPARSVCVLDPPVRHFRHAITNGEVVRYSLVLRHLPENRQP